MESIITQIPERIKLIRTLKQRSLHDCAKLLGIEKEQYHQFEEGVLLFSLPEIELLATFLEIPIKMLFEDAFDPFDNISVLVNEKKAVYINLRNKMIMAQLAVERKARDISLKALNQGTDIPIDILQSYEANQTAIPLDDLILICEYLETPIETFLRLEEPDENTPQESEKEANWEPEYPEVISEETDEDESRYQQLTQALRAIPQKDQAEIAKILLQKLKAL